MTRALLAVALALTPSVVSAGPCDVTPLTPAEVRSIGARYDDWNLDVLESIVKRESTYCPTAVNGRYRGLGQVDVEYAVQLGVEPRLLLVPEANIAVMHYVFLRWGSTWGAWDF